MRQCVVLIVDPNKARRDRIGQSFRSRFEVLTARAPAGALERISADDPDIILLSLPQADGHGLDLALQVRALESGSDKVIVVYGMSAGDRRLTPEVRTRFRKRFKLDGFLPGLPQPQDVPQVAGSVPEKTVRKQPQPQANTPTPSPTLKAQSARIGAPPEPSLGELLRSEANMDNLVALLKTEVGGEMIEELDDNTEEVSWSDLLRAKATAKNIRKALRKEIKLGSD